MPFSSSALTSVASLYCAGGWVNFWSATTFTRSSVSPSRSGGSIPSWESSATGASSSGVSR